MGTVMLATVGEFIQENTPMLAALLIGFLALLVMRLVRKMMTRIVLLSVLLGLGLFLWVERDDLHDCAQDCTCSLGGVQADFPFCSANPHVHLP